MPVRIGVLLDSWIVPQWQWEIIQFMQRHPDIMIQAIVLNVSPASGKASGREVYKSFMKIDRAVFSLKHDAFKKVNVEAHWQGIEILKITTAKKKYITEVSHSDIALIKSKALDVLVRFGFGIIKGDLLQAARLGIWSLHHGDTAVNRGGPPAFWEVVNREVVSGVTLQQLTDKLDGGIVLGKAFTRTDQTSFTRNQNTVFWSGVELFCAALNHVATYGNHEALISQHRNAPIYSGPLYRDPSNRKAIKIFLQFWFTRLGKVVMDRIRKQQWSIYIGEGTYTEKLPVHALKKLTPPRGADWADPFLIRKDNRHYLFFEELPARSEKAHISVLEWDVQMPDPRPVKVLEEAHHLSYPFVFEHGGSHYMLPEAASGNQVWLYVAEEFPGRWKKHTLLLMDKAVYDPTLFYKEGYWYLFGTEKPYGGSSADQYVNIYFSKDLFAGEWQAHPQNPVTRDVRGARPAGRIVNHEGKMIRPAQIGAPKYGYGIRFYEIVKLTPTAYEERILHDILPDWRKGLLATHTFNECDGLIVVDAQT